MSDDLTFQDTPLYAWLKANVWYLLGGLVVFLAIMLYRENAPKWKFSGLSESWDQHRSLISDPQGMENLAVQLAESKKDERIHQWVVYNAARTASDLSDAAALAILKPELEALAQSSNVMISTPAGQENMASFLLRSLYQGASKLPKDPVAPEPTGGRVSISISLDGVSTYDIILGLYEDIAPDGTTALKQWITDGRFTDQTARRVGDQSLTMTMAALEAAVVEGDENPTVEGAEEPALMIERKYGYFHSEGTLATGMIPGKAGVQDINNLQLALSNSYNMDGQTTVLAKVVEGWQALKDGLELADPSAELKVLSARILE
ncbi:MAG: hypothetical protein O3A20_01620 [Planctomycetota bacterium]|nr:hypothetical protein [Planctomycetota bacterium]